MSAELKQWSHDELKRSITGKLYNNLMPEFDEGEEFTITNFAYAVEYKPAHHNDIHYWLIRTTLGNYFMIRKDEEKK